MITDLITESRAGSENAARRRKIRKSETSKQDPLLRPQPKETTLGRKAMQL